MAKDAKILVVEDEPRLLADIVEELVDAGYEALSAESGDRAVEILEHNEPDLILCDMMMPVMDGPALLKAVRETMPKHHDVPFIFLTARATRDDVISGKTLGADDYLTKPVDYDMLLATVDAHLRQVRRIGQKHKDQLRTFYEATKKALAPAGPLRITLVTGNLKFVTPIQSALQELGCKVTVLPEDSLARNRKFLEKEDLVFLVYSLATYGFFKSDVAAKGNRGKYIVLAPPRLTDEHKALMARAGIERLIHYPYRPLELFRFIMSEARRGGGARFGAGR